MFRYVEIFIKAFVLEEDDKIVEKDNLVDRITRSSMTNRWFSLPPDQENSQSDFPNQASPFDAKLKNVSSTFWTDQSSQRSPTWTTCPTSTVRKQTTLQTTVTLRTIQTVQVRTTLHKSTGSISGTQVQTIRTGRTFHFLGNRPEALEEARVLHRMKRTKKTSVCISSTMLVFLRWSSKVLKTATSQKLVKTIYESSKHSD